MSALNVALPCVPEKRGLTICISGSIAVGKTTLIKQLKSTVDEMHLSCHVLPELLCPSLNKQLPINPKLFDTFIIAHRLQMCFDAPHIARNYNLLMMERCHLDHLAFLFAFDKIGTIARGHTDWVREIIKELNPPVPDRFIFLNISPELAFKRMCMRNENRDSNFGLSFVQALMDGYEQVIDDYALGPRLTRLNWESFGADISWPQVFSDWLHKPGLS